MDCLKAWKKQNGKLKQHNSTQMTHELQNFCPRIHKNPKK